MEGIGVGVETSLLRDSRPVVERLDKGEVVTAHLKETVGVLVKEGREGNRVRTVLTVLRRDSAGDTASGVVGPFAGLVVGRGSTGTRNLGDSRVGNVPEESLDGVTETDVIAGVRVSANLSGVESAAAVTLDLLNNHIARALAHLDTLFVGNDSVVSPELDVAEVDRRLNEIRRLGTFLEDEELAPVTELEMDAHLVVREGSRGEGNTTATREEEGERDVDGVGREVIVRVVEIGNVANHVVITGLLASRNSVGGPHIKPVGVEFLNLEIVERDPAEVNKVVTNVLAPTDTTVTGGTTRNTKGRKRGTEPDVKEVVTSTGDLESNITVKVGVTGVLRERNRNLGEPGRLTDTTDEMRDGSRTVVEILFNFIKSSKINKGASNSVRH